MIFFLQAQEAAQIVVARAPSLGYRMKLSSRHVTVLAAEHGLRWPNPARLKAVIVTRASKVLPREEIVDELALALEETGIHGPFQIRMADQNLTVRVPKDAPASFEFIDLDVSSQTGRFHAQLRAPAGDFNAPIIPISGRVIATIDVPTLTTTKEKGSVVAARDIQWITLRHDRVGANVLTDKNELIGKAVTRRIAAGRTLRASDVETPVIMSKGSLVTITYRIPTMRLTAEGRALMGGGYGETIRVVNTRSNQTIYATIDGPNQVTVVPHQLQVSSAQ